MTIKETIDDVLIAIANRTGKPVDESRRSERAIYRKLKDYRIRILREKRDKGRDFTSFDLMTIPCVPLVEADISECPWAPKDGPIVLRSKHPIPRVIDGRIHSVSNLNFTQSYDFRTIEQLQDLSGGRFAFIGTDPIYTTQNILNMMFLYVLNDIQKESVAVRLLPEDPIQVLEFPICGKEYNPECLNIMEMEFPIDADLRGIVIDKTVEFFLMRDPQIGDIKQNDTDDTAVPPNNIK